MSISIIELSRITSFDNFYLAVFNLYSILREYDLETKVYFYHSEVKNQGTIQFALNKKTGENIEYLQANNGCIYPFAYNNLLTYVTKFEDWLLTSAREIYNGNCSSNYLEFDPNTGYYFCEYNFEYVGYWFSQIVNLNSSIQFRPLFQNWKDQVQSLVVDIDDEIPSWLFNEV